MFTFYNATTVDRTQDFDNLIAAIKGHDAYFIIDSLNSNPEFSTKKSKDAKTIPMLAAQYGCTVDLFSFILTKTEAVLDEKSQGGETLASILIKNKRQELVEVLQKFQAKNSSTSISLGAS